MNAATARRSTALDEGRLPAGDVNVRIEYSTLNYKDALAITGKAPVVRQFPMVPGIDFAGTVEASENAAYRRGGSRLAQRLGGGGDDIGAGSRSVPA